MNRERRASYTARDPRVAPRAKAFVTSSRSALLQRLRARLLRSGWPRLQMLLIVTLTAGGGLLASWALWHGGMQAMAMRYPIAVLLAYGVFLTLLWLWMRRAEDEWPELEEDDLLDRRRRDAHDDDAARLDSDATSSQEGSSSLSDALDLGAADEAAIPLALLALLLALCAALLFALVSVVWSAPVLFAELLLDGVLAAGLYRRLRRADTRHWLESALRRTVWPFVAVLLSALLVGAALQWHAPHATTLAQALGAG
jgi:hypothetical protein